MDIKPLHTFINSTFFNAKVCLSSVLEPLKSLLEKHSLRAHFTLELSPLTGLLLANLMWSIHLPLSHLLLLDSSVEYT